MQVWYLICSYVGEGVVFAGLVSLTSFPYSLELLVPGRGFSASSVLLCVRRLGAFGFLWEREQVCEMQKWVNFVVCASVFVYLR